MSDWLDEADEGLAKEEAAQEKASEAVTWKPEEGDVLKGTLLTGDLVEGTYGPTYVLTIEDTDKKVWTVWAGNKLLKDAVTDQEPAPGKGIAIKFGGLKQPSKPGGREYKMFTLQCEGKNPEYWMNVARRFRQKQEDSQESYSGGTSTDELEAPY